MKKYTIIILLEIIAILLIWSSIFYMITHDPTVVNTPVVALNTSEIEDFNKKYTKYEGTKKGITVEELLKEIEKNSHENNFVSDILLEIKFVDDEEYYVSRPKMKSIYVDSNFQNYLEQIDNIIGKLKSKSNYIISFEYEDDLGVLDCIIIEREK